MFFSLRSVLLPSPCCFIDASALAPFPVSLLPFAFMIACCDYTSPGILDFRLYQLPWPVRHPSLTQLSRVVVFLYLFNALYPLHCHSALTMVIEGQLRLRDTGSVKVHRTFNGAEHSSCVIRAFVFIDGCRRVSISKKFTWIRERWVVLLLGTCNLGSSFHSLNLLFSLHRSQQLRSPKVFPDLIHLKCFTARYANLQTRKEASSLCKWIRRVISTSSIQVLRILQNESEDDLPTSRYGANVSFRSIIDHLCSRHSVSLRILDMKNAYVDVRSLKKLFVSCQAMEEVYLCAGRHALVCRHACICVIGQWGIDSPCRSCCRRFSISTVHCLRNSTPHLSTLRTLDWAGGMSLIWNSSELS